MLKKIRAQDSPSLAPRLLRATLKVKTKDRSLPLFPTPPWPSVQEATNEGPGGGSHLVCALRRLLITNHQFIKALARPALKYRFTTFGGVQY